jgi:SAM-dependent methyltransferase
MSDRLTAGSPRPDTQPNVHETILAWFPPGGTARILDAGAGEGALSDALRRRGYRVVACDVSPSRFRASGVPCIRADLAACLPFADASFDGVVSSEVLEHLENPHHLAREYARILRPGGAFVLTTPNILNVYSRLHFLLLGTCDFFDTLSGSRETAFHGAKGHINPVGFPELRYLLTRAGLRITDVTTNRDIRVALRDTTGWPRYAWPALAVMASAARRVTRLVRRTDQVAGQLLSPALLYGEDLIVRGIRPSPEDGEHA